LIAIPRCTTEVSLFCIVIAGSCKINADKWCSR
jgi:hypothetical protein